MRRAVRLAHSAMCGYRKSITKGVKIYDNIHTLDYTQQKSLLMNNNLLPKVSEDDSIVDWDDKFGLVRFTEPSLILEHLQSVKYGYSFDELTYFLLRVQAIYDSGDHSQDRGALQGFLDEFKARLRKDRQGKWPLLG